MNLVLEKEINAHLRPQAIFQTVIKQKVYKHDIDC